VIVDEDAPKSSAPLHAPACGQCQDREARGVDLLARVLDRAAERIGLSPSVLVAMLSDDTLAHLYFTCRSESVRGGVGGVSAAGAGGGVSVAGWWTD
jgi:hypothetical protein